MRISLTAYVEEEEEEDLILTFGQILHNSLRRSDIIMRRNMQREGLYSSVDMNVDSMIIGPDREYETWFRVAV